MHVPHARTPLVAEAERVDREVDVQTVRAFLGCKHDSMG